MGKMKANRKFVKGEEAVSAVIGVILMVAITVAIAATVYVYVSGMIGTSPTSTATISMVSKSGYIQIATIQNGPVPVTSVTLRALTSVGVDVNGTEVNLILNNAGANVAGGDTITVTVLNATSGDVYTVQMVSASTVFGEVKYTIP
jgi:flagellin-like protein